MSTYKNYTVSYKEYAAVRSNFGSMSHALRWPRNGNKFRRISRRQASQLPRRCDIPAASSLKKATPFFIPLRKCSGNARDAVLHCAPRFCPTHPMNTLIRAIEA